MSLQVSAVDMFAKGWSSMEVDLGGQIFTYFAKVSYGQPVEEGEVPSTSVVPTKRTKGKQKLGQGEIEFSDIDEAQRFVDALGDGYCEKIWNASFTYWRRNQSTIKHELFGCRVLDVKDDHSEGVESLHESIPISFMTVRRNGKRAFTSQ
jgi:hypothetical protein